MSAAAEKSDKMSRVQDNLVTLPPEADFVNVCSLAWSYVLGQFPRSPISPACPGIRFLIVLDLFRRGVPTELSTQPGGDDSEMAHGGGQVALLHVRIGALSASHAIQEVANVRTVQVRRRSLERLHQGGLQLLAGFVRHLRLYCVSTACKAQHSFGPEDIQRERIAL